MKSVKKIIISVCVSFSFLTLYLVLDYFDVLSKSGIVINKLNYDILEIIVNIVLVVLGFLVTYFLIDRHQIEIEKRQIEKEKCKVECSKLYINETLEICIQNIHLLDDKSNRYSMVKKCNFNVALLEEDKVLNNFLTMPFKYNNYIFDAANEGLFSKDLLKEYLIVERLYRSYILMRVTFFDAEDKDRCDLVDYLNNDKNKLLKAINNTKIIIK